MATTTDHLVDIKGVPLRDGKVYAREEVSTWAKDPENSIQVSLMIRALQAFYQIDYKDTRSYFQIGGIHGYPKMSWDGSPAPDEKYGPGFNPEKVYCTHSTIRFPTWHRPYMVLFEQRLHELMLEVIETLEFAKEGEKDEWISEAYKWRFPYWDWALNHKVPAIFEQPDIEVRLPLDKKGKRQEPEIVSNPLWRYQCLVDGKPTPMGALDGDYKIKDFQYEPEPKPQFFPWSKCSGTSRACIGNDRFDWTAGYNNWKGTNRQLKAHSYYTPGGKDSTNVDPDQSWKISDLCYRMWTPDYMPEWRQFSTTKYVPGTGVTNWTDYLSIEYIHNNLHGFIGGFEGNKALGHMSNVPVAAFDPIFYFHHNNIDRMFAIWQTLFPNIYHEDDKLGPDDKKATEPLYPFWRTVDGEWKPYNTNDIRDWTTMGYDFDVLQPQEGEVRGSDNYRKRIRAYLDKTYRDTGNVVRAADVSLFGDFSIKNNTYPDYIINVVYDRHGYHGFPYYIHFFLGKVADSEVVGTTALAAEHPRHVGSIFTFSSSWESDDSGVACLNCAKQKEEGDLCAAQIPLTTSLIGLAKEGEINAVDLGTVTSYLETNLTWKAVSVGGRIIPPEQLPNTKVFALHGQGQHFQEDGVMSIYSGYQEMSSVTKDKDWGAMMDDYTSEVTEG